MLVKAQLRRSKKPSVGAGLTLSINGRFNAAYTLLATVRI